MEHLGTHSPAATHTKDRVESALLVVTKDGKQLLRLGYDGSSEVSDDYTPDEAAEIFWRSLTDLEVLERAAHAKGYRLVEATS
jgi:hypothetical protein